MHEHLNIPKSVYDELGLTAAEVIPVLPLFGPSDEVPKHKGDFVQRRFTYVNLLHYIDNCGPSFMLGQPNTRHKIAKAIFDSCDAARKLVVYGYIEWYDEEREK